MAAALSFSTAAFAQGTKLWTVDRYDSMERGTADGVQIRNDGRIEAGPGSSLLYDSAKSYAWSMATDPAGIAYLGLGGSSAGSAQVMQVAPDGKATKLFESKELAIQSIAVARDGSVIAATSPDGKVYRVSKGGSNAGTVIFDPSTTEEKPKYLWSVAAAGNGDVYVAAGAPAVVYKVSESGGKPQVLFKTADQHIRCLLLAEDGTLWAGSDGSGVVYRIDTKVAGAKPFAVYAAPRREITALATDSAGNIYIAGVGGKGAAPLPPLPATGNVGVSITFVQPASSSAAGANALIPEGSDIYRIAKDGTPSRLVQMKDDVIYALAVRNGSLFAATGNRGRIYRVDTASTGRFTDVTHLDSSQGMAFAAIKDGLLVATANSGKIFRLTDAPAKEPTYTSEVFDAQGYSQWGRVESRISGGAAKGYDLWVRSGNVESPLMGWSDWSKVGADGAVSVPAGRYAQWKAVMHPAADAAVSIDMVGLNYLPRNVAPVIDEIVVQPGARMPSSAPQTSGTVQVAFPPSANSPAVSFQQDPGSTPLTAQKDKSSVTARWLSHDENGDETIFSVWYRGAGEKNWRLLKDKVTDRYYSFDSSLLPDGVYNVKVVASDSPAHTDSEALSGERESPVFVVDTTPPVPGTLAAALVPGDAKRIHVTLEAHDATSPIAHAEYSVDAGPWQYLEPVGKVSDSQTERYDFTAEVPAATTPVEDAKEHVVAVRVYDRYENMAAAKAVVR